MEDILIDTDIVIEYLRNKDKSSTQLVKMIRKHDLFLSSISEFELFLGAKTERHRLDLEMLFNEIEVLPFDFGCGQIAANIWNNLKNKHQHTEIKDIFIASIAIRNNIWIFTYNKKHFTGIENVRIWKDSK